MAKSNIKKVLSIDLDILAWECIQLYNDKVGTDGLKREDFWQFIEETMHASRFMCINEKAKEYIKNLLLNVVKNTSAKNILFAEDHDMVLSLLCSKKEQASEMLELYNIDHHHDIYYSQEQREEVERFDFTSLASWVYYLAKNEKIDKYFWINDKFSCGFPDEERNELDFPYETIDIDSLIENDTLPKTFDYVFVCLSPEYFPKEFWSIFDELKQAVEEVKGEEIAYQNESYCKDGKTRHIA